MNTTLWSALCVWGTTERSFFITTWLRFSITTPLKQRNAENRNKESLLFLTSAFFGEQHFSFTSPHFTLLQLDKKRKEAISAIRRKAVILFIFFNYFPSSSWNWRGISSTVTDSSQMASNQSLTFHLFIPRWTRAMRAQVEMDGGSTETLFFLKEIRDEKQRFDNTEALPGSIEDSFCRSEHVV